MRPETRARTVLASSQRVTLLMIEQKLIVGRYLELNTPTPAFAGPAVNGFQEVARVVLHIEQSESMSTPVGPMNVMPGFNPTFKQQVQIGMQRAGQHVQAQFDRQRTSTTGVGAVAKAHRNFIWLEWLPGFVSEVQPQGMDVLTGPMTGCWITAYIRNGIHYIGHVGTENLPTSANSIAAKNAWNTFARGVPMGAFSGFNPTGDPWTAAPVQPLPGETARKTFALITSDGTFHTVVGYSQVGKPSRIRIAGIQQNRSSLPQNGQIP
jgi:hypothetical protein